MFLFRFLRFQCLQLTDEVKGFITVEAVRSRASWRLKVLPARSLRNLYQTADSISDNLRRQRVGGKEWE